MWGWGGRLDMEATEKLQGLVSSKTTNSSQPTPGMTSLLILAVDC